MVCLEFVAGGNGLSFEIRQKVGDKRSELGQRRAKRGGRRVKDNTQQWKDEAVGGPSKGSQQIINEVTHLQMKQTGKVAFVICQSISPQGRRPGRSMELDQPMKLRLAAVIAVQ